MRSRMIDLALLIGLVAVAGGILWTLFTLGREPRVANPPSQPAPTASAPATQGGAAPSADGAAGNVAIEPTAPGAPADAAPVDEPPPAAAADVDPAGAGLADTPPAPPRVLPEGALELERVGFSFVTGGPGACGVVLEAWTHVAVSRDLLETYGCGAEVTVVLDDAVDGRTEVLGVIGDTMNPSFARTVNVYVGEDEPAFEYGLTAGTFQAR